MASVSENDSSDQLELFEGVNLEGEKGNFITPSTGYSSQNGLTSGSRMRMLPPVQFNILGRMQRRKPPTSPDGSVFENERKSSPPHRDERGGQLEVAASPGKRGLFQQELKREVGREDSKTLPSFRRSNHGNDSSSSPSDSPLDFSKKPKFDLTTAGTLSPEICIPEERQSPSSRLRNILSMKGHNSPENIPHAILLNLSKESSVIPIKTSDSISGSSSSCSPLPVEPSKGSLCIPNSHSNGVPFTSASPSSALDPTTLFVSSASSNIGSSPVRFPPYGLFSPANLGTSPRLHQATSSVSIPFPFELSPAVPGGDSVQLPTSVALPPNEAGSKGRVTRPFKAYPKDPMSFSSVGLYGLPLGTMPGSTEALIHQQSNVAYAEFRKQMLSQSHTNRSRRGNNQRSGVSPALEHRISSNPHNFSMESESSNEHNPSDPSHGGKSNGKTEQQLKDEAYWERRRKNNEAAKRSRDARRAKEDEIAIRAAFLEQENLKLRFELCALKNETAKLRCMLYSS